MVKKDVTDPLAEPLASRLFGALVELRRPATTMELSERVGRHHNTVRRHLERLAGAGLLERRTVRADRGRPPAQWAIAPGARPYGAPPQGYADLARWLARALRSGAGIEATGREVGRELAPRRNGHTTLQDVFAALGFAPRAERPASGRVRYVLGNCPYREAVSEDQPTVCGLHRGIARGLLDRLDPDAELAAFVPRDPYEAGCVVEVSSRRATSASTSSGSVSSAGKSSRSSKRT